MNMSYLSNEDLLEDLIVDCPECGERLLALPCGNCGLDEDTFNAWICDEFKKRMQIEKLSDII